MHLLRYKKVDAMMVLELVTERLMDELGLENLELRTRLTTFRQDFCFKTLARNGQARHEESMMVACGYPGLDNHHQVHQYIDHRYRKDAVQLYRLELSTYELVKFPYNWCTDHVQGMDWAFASHCKYKSNLIEQILEQRA
ncbi:MAG: hypothetical protein GY731_15505 [Gammaproteobacteria bacterium]|nr:hypothetical protein [Gammaproteobacteria bacterium]